LELRLTEEQEQLRNMVREFAANEIAPHVREWDEHSTFPVELIEKLGRLGLMGIIFPEEYGGAGLGYVEYSTAIQELARVDGAVALIVAAHNSLCTNHIFQSGTEAQRKKFLPDLTTGRKL
jgi:alkylation response protein AidB-like acyl-CoA dehydrogenase